MTNTRDSFVNVKPVIVADTPDAHQVWLDIGVQHFQIGSYWETKEEAEFSAKMLRNAISNIKGPSVDEMVNRFLGWKLPDDFYPDHGISFVRNEFHERHGMPTGTNLFHAGQAQTMFQHCLAWQADLQSGAGDGARLDFLESLAVADIDEKAITRLVIFNLWRGTTYDDLRTAIDNAQATEGK